MTDTLATFIFLLSPVIFLCILTALYKKVGRMQVFSLDLVLLTETFLFFPIFVIWIKYALYIFAAKMRYFLLIESFLTIFLLYLYAAVVTHLFTKSLSLYHYSKSKRHIISVTEFFHHKVAHVAIYGGVVLLCTFFSLMNLASPITTLTVGNFMWVTIILGSIGGFASYQSVCNYQGRGMAKFQSALFTLGLLCVLLHVVGFMLMRPSWLWSYALYWMSFPGYITFSLSLGIRKLLLR